jgi:hypothetical protein
MYEHSIVLTLFLFFTSAALTTTLDLIERQVLIIGYIGLRVEFPNTIRSDRLSAPGQHDEDQTTCVLKT